MDPFLGCVASFNYGNILTTTKKKIRLIELLVCFRIAAFIRRMETIFVPGEQNFAKDCKEGGCSFSKSGFIWLSSPGTLPKVVNKNCTILCLYFSFKQTSKVF